MNARKLNRREFARAIRNGLGSASLHIKEYGDAGMEDLLLKACLTNMTYDRQFESSRAPWLADMLDHTADIDFYAKAIEEALLARRINDTDLCQLIELASLLFVRGFTSFRKLLLELAPVADYYVSLILGEAWIDIAPFAGFEMAIHAVVDCAEGFWSSHTLMKYACEQLGGEEQVIEFLQQKGRTDPQIAKFWSDLQAERELWNQPYQPSQDIWTLDQVLHTIQNDPKPQKYRGKYLGFGKRASEADLEYVCRRLETETDRSRLIAYFSIFAMRPMPLILDRVVQFLFCKDKEVRWAARRALSNCRSEQLRIVVLQALQSRSQQDLLSAFKLLRSNYQPEDVGSVSTALRRLKTGENIHSAGLDLSDIATKTNDIGLAEILRYLHDHSPCGTCRECILRLLIQWRTGSDQIIYEAQWDVEPETRQMAQEYFKSLQEEPASS